MSYTNGAASWHPTVLYLLGLILAEIAIMAALRTLTKHGG